MPFRNVADHYARMTRQTLRAAGLSEQMAELLARDTVVTLHDTGVQTG
jgi:hypothetical protein